MCISKDHILSQVAHSKCCFFQQLLRGEVCQWVAPNKLMMVFCVYAMCEDNKLPIWKVL